MPSRLHALLLAVLLLGLYESQVSPSARAGRTDPANEALLQTADGNSPCSPCGLYGRRYDLPAVAGTTLPQPESAFAAIVSGGTPHERVGAEPSLARHFTPLR
jgi:hypothetical protein